MKRIDFLMIPFMKPPKEIKGVERIIAWIGHIAIVLGIIFIVFIYSLIEISLILNCYWNIK